MICNVVCVRFDLPLSAKHIASGVIGLNHLISDYPFGKPPVPVFGHLQRISELKCCA
jgi:hypothetical protein